MERRLLNESFKTMRVFKAPHSSSCDLDTYLVAFCVFFFKARNVGGNYFSVFSLKLLGSGVDVASFTPNQTPQKHEQIQP